MERLKKVSIILQLINNLKDNNSKCGETHIQKAMYFLQALKKVPTDFDFILYKHGPFSFDLRDELTSMRADQLLEIHANIYHSGLSLLPTESGKELIKHFPKTLEKFEKQIDFVAENCIGNKGAAKLERISTALFLTLRSDKAKKEIMEELVVLKPHISKEKAVEAVEFIEKITLQAQNIN